jgi:hypothetical protein
MLEHATCGTAEDDMIAVQLELPGLAELDAAAQPHTSGAVFPATASSKLLCAPDDLAEFTAEIERARSQLPSRVNVDPEDVERGLSTLVLTVIELLRQLMERQALRRMEAGTINDEQIERLGQAFIQLEQRMVELKAIFGLRDEDLNLDLGPLGRLM